MTPSGRGRLRSQDGPARRRSDDGWTYVRPKRSNTAPPAPSQAATAKGTPEKGQSRSPAICCAFKAYASDQHPRQARWSAPERSSGNGGLGPWVHLPIPGKQVGDFVGGVIWKPCQHVSEPDLGIDVVHLAGFDQGVDGGGTVAARVRTGKGPVSSSDRHTSQRSFSGVVRKTDAAVVEEAGERCPAVEKVVDRLGGIVLGGEQRSLLVHPDFKLGSERPRLFTAHGKPLLRRFAINAALDLEEHLDTTYSFAGDRRLSLFHQIDKLPPAVAPAGRFKDRSRLPLRLVELVVSIKGIGLHEAHIAGKMALRMLPGTTARVMERCRWWVFAAKRPIIADIGPDPAGDSLQFREYGHRRVIGVDAFRAHDMGSYRLNNWVERHHAGADPIRQGRDIDLDPFAGIGLALAVQRLMQQG